MVFIYLSFSYSYIFIQADCSILHQRDQYTQWCNLRNEGKNTMDLKDIVTVHRGARNEEVRNFS